ncbi:MAG: hypothetical protein IJE45_06115 [Bacilli bacterium]|nr:hypothetical protein [Bacilli bacterium]
MYTYVPLIILIIEIIMLLFFVIFSIKKNIIISKDTVWYIFPSCILLFILYVIGLHYTSELNGVKVTIFDYFVICEHVISSSFFEINQDMVADLVEYSNIYSIAFFGAVFLLVSSLYITILSSLIVRVINKIRVSIAIKKDCDILIGENKFNEIYYQQYKKCLVLTESYKKEKFFEYYFNGIPVINMSFTKDNLVKLLKKCFKKNNIVNFISFNDSNANLKYIDEFKEFLNLEINKVKVVSKKQFFLKVELDFHNQLTIQNRILEEQDFSAFITCFNRYEYLALEFIEKNPITKNMPSCFFDYDTASLKNDTKINVYYLGYGKVSRALHRAQLMNDQLPTIINGNVKPYSINYYAFDNSNSSIENKNTIFYSERYDEHINEFDGVEYFDKVNKMETIKYFKYDVNSNELFGEIVKTMFTDELEKTYNRIIVSFGEDIDNLDYALKLKGLFEERKYENYEIFVRIKNDPKLAMELLNSSHITVFGNIKSVFNHQVIVNEELMELAKDLNSKYNGKHLYETSWYELSAIKQFSNIYSSLNIRLKLNLLGFDYVKENTVVDNTEVNKELKKVIKTDLDNYNEYLFFEKKEKTPVNVISYQEHMRWNAFYISYGYVPMKKKDIYLIDETDARFYKDNDILREHACITTYEGLNDYHHHLAALLSERNNKSISENLEIVHTYRYDYMLIEDILKLFVNTKYRLINKKQGGVNNE